MARIIRRAVKIGDVGIGGRFPVAIQSMVKARTSDVAAAVAQILALERAGCEIIRVAVKDQDDARAIAAIKERINIPLVADIHFDWRLALASIAAGADKVRLNPGNISKPAQVKEVAMAAKKAGIPIRVGLNSGSVGGKGDQVRRMVKAGRGYIKLIESFGFRDLVVSLKAQNIQDTVAAYRQMSRLCPYPLHLGVTATGLPYEGLIKSCVAIGALLLEGIGDTIRISLTDTPEEEVRAARALLKSLGLRSFGPEIISCPTCGRCEVDLVSMVKELEKRLSCAVLPKAGSAKSIAVMGCVVNGPGEAKHADIGIAFGKDQGLLFRKGKAVRKIPAGRCVEALMEEIKGLLRRASPSSQ